MSRRLLRRLFPMVAILCLAPLPIAYAHDITAAQEAVKVTAADAAAMPSGKVFGKAICGVNPGDLFYIDATATPANIRATLTITNALEVSRYLSYLILRMGVYAEGASGDPLCETLITLTDAEVSFELPGGATYRIAIDGGNFRAARPVKDRDIVSPRFYLRVQ